MPADFLLVIEGIKGESKDSKHKDSIEVESFSWGTSNPGSFAAGGGGGSGKPSFQDAHFTSKVNKSSSQLMLACASGQHIKKAQLFVRKGGGDQQEFYKITMEDVLVSSYQSGGHDAAGAQVPTDQFSLNFASIKFEYFPQKEDGSLDSVSAAGWDVKANKKK